MPTPDISIIIPTHNRANQVCQAVKSCLATQDCTLEVLIVDDGSTDGTRDRLTHSFPKTFFDENDVKTEGGTSILANLDQFDKNRFPKVRYIFQASSGACVARNTGLQAAIGQYVKFLDSDDELVPGSLAKELAYARRTGADVVVTGWQDRIFNRGNMLPSTIKHSSAPKMDRGIDDMLLGRSPCISAALYRRTAISTLSWDVNLHKAQDWGWVWAVCLSGASFTTLDIESFIYNHHPGERMSEKGNPFLKSTESRQLILKMAEKSLRGQGALTTDRRHALVQYYYRDSKVLCDLSPSKWHELWLHCKELAPGYVPHEENRLARPFVKILGTYWGIRLYVILRRWVRPFFVGMFSRP